MKAYQQDGRIVSNGYIIQTTDRVESFDKYEHYGREDARRDISSMASVVGNDNVDSVIVAPRDWGVTKRYGKHILSAGKASSFAKSINRDKMYNVSLKRNEPSSLLKRLLKLLF